MNKEIVDTWLYDNHILKMVVPKPQSNVISLPRAKSNIISEKLKRTLYYIKFPMHKDDFQPFYTTVIEPFLTDSVEQLGLGNIRRIIQTSIVTQDQDEQHDIYHIYLGSIPDLCNKLLSYYH